MKSYLMVAMIVENINSYFRSLFARIIFGSLKFWKIAFAIYENAVT